MDLWACRWDEGLLGMCVGEKRLLTIKPEFGYGNQPMGPIPAGSTLSPFGRLIKRCCSSSLTSILQSLRRSLWASQAFRKMSYRVYLGSYSTCEGTKLRNGFNSTDVERQITSESALAQRRKVLGNMCFSSRLGSPLYTEDIHFSITL